MPTTRFESAVRRIRTLTSPLPIGGDDCDLLRRFLANRDEAAFSELVVRHGNMVLGVCRRVLNNRHDAEDAFQATFLVLARRAGSIRNSASLGCWLHGVAFRVASKLKTRLTKQPRSTNGPEPSASDDDLSWREVRRILDEEVSRLPERWRLPVLLCYFEGKARDEAAEALGWKLSTLKGRLEDGRNRLRIRLAKRGVELSAALLAISASSDGTAIADNLLQSTLASLGPHASQPIRSLANGVAMAGSLGTLKVAVGAILVAIGLGAGLFAFRGEAGESPQPKEKKNEPIPRQAELPGELLALMRAADRVWVVDEPTDEKPIPEPAEVLKGQTPPSGYRVDYAVEDLKGLPRKGHRWIVFLKSIEEVDHKPQITKLSGEQWYLPVEEKTIALLRDDVPPCAWGDEGGDLRFGIWPRPADEPTVELVLQNVGKQDLTIPQLRGNYWDDWTPLTFSITTPAGKAHTVVRHGPPLKDGDAPRDRVLKPGERYIHVVRLGRWISPSAKNRGFGLSNGGAPEGLFASGGDFKVRATFSRPGAYKVAGQWAGTLETKPVTVTVPKGGFYGDASGELSLRLHQPTAIKSGDDPDLIFDLKYSGKTDRRVNGRSIHTEVEVDGIWYRAISDKELTGIREVELKANSQYSPFLSIKPDRTWFHLRTKPGTEDDPDAPKEAIPFRLTPGLRTVRVAYRFSETERPISNPVTIEVTPDGWGESSGGIKSRLRLAKRRFVAGEPLAFELDLKNASRRSQTVSPIPFNAGICLDNRWYYFQGPVDYKSVPKELKSGSEISPFVEVTSTPDWKTNRLPLGDGKADFDSLTLTPGMHKVRVSYVIEAGKIEPSSNELEFEVLGIDPTVRALADRADRIWVVKAPTEAMPIPGAEKVLKGPLRPNINLFDLRLLPGEDPKKKFIVFLQANEDAVASPAVTRMPGATWSIPYSDEVAQAIRKSLEPASWSEEQGGLRFGLRLRQVSVAMGQPLFAEVSVTNSGAKEVSLTQNRLNIYDYWPGLQFKVTAPDGSKWVLEKPEGSMNEADSAHVISLNPGESYVHSVRLDRWPARSTITTKPESIANRFDKTGEYLIQATYRYKRPGPPAWTAHFESPQLKLNLTNADDWGEETGGLKAQVRPTQAKFREGEPLVFELNLKNVGAATIVDLPIPFYCQIQFDGDWYTYQFPGHGPVAEVKLEPGTQRVAHVKVSAAGDGSWKFIPPHTDKGGGPAEAKTLTLSPGSHKLRVSYPVAGQANQRVLSQLAEIEVVSK